MRESEGIVVRKAALTDSQEARAIVELLDAHARSPASYGGPLPETLKGGLVADLSARSDVVVLLALAGSAPVGVAVCLGGAWTFDPGVLRLHDVAVTTDYAGDRSEVAMLLMQASEALARTRPVRALASVEQPDLYLRVGIDVLQDWDVFVGGAVTPETYLAGIRNGAFLLSAGNTRRWCRPSQRAVRPLDWTKWPGTVRRAMRRPKFRVTIDRAFADVVRACAVRPGQATWIDEDVIAMEVSLYERGLAHSVEVWNTETNMLVGGIFGVSMGAVFAAESMFHRETDASKVAFASLAERLRSADFRLFDVQLMTPHLASLGCVDITREQYRKELASALNVQRSFPGASPIR